jgi:nucleoside-diphosphate-sugar epimerase
MKILVTGGLGFVGTPLVESLSLAGHKITIIDTGWFGNYLSLSNNIELIKSDIRNPESLPDENFDTVIHLANIANDPSVELNPVLSWEVNVLATYELLVWAKNHMVKKFIYASSGSVYGVKKEAFVTENLDPVPISTYNKTKMVAERVVMNFEKNFSVYCVRPATICGWSKKMRLDLAVNGLTFDALSKNRVTVQGGTQVRPNIHIDDMVSVYLHFVNCNGLESGFYNAGFENLSINEIANLITGQIPATLETVQENDIRSYRLDSTKLLNSGFSPKKTVKNAILEIEEMFKSGKLLDNIDWHTVDKMKLLGLNNSR